MAPLTVLALAAVLSPAAHHAKPRHTRCHTPACARRVDARRAAHAPMRSAIASWYDDAGATASGTHYTRGFAALIFGSRWGQRVEFTYRGRWAIGRLEDHGPYISGRTFDLGPALKAALGCSDLCPVRWRALR